MIADTDPLPEDLGAIARTVQNLSPVCVVCAKDSMLCDCTNKVPGQDLAFLGSEQFDLPASASVRDHLGRFVAEVERHSVLQNSFAMRQMINDFLAKGLIANMRVRAAHTQSSVCHTIASVHANFMEHAHPRAYARQPFARANIAMAMFQRCLWHPSTFFSHADVKMQLHLDPQ